MEGTCKKKRGRKNELSSSNMEGTCTKKRRNKGAEFFGRKKRPAWQQQQILLLDLTRRHPYLCFSVLDLPDALFTHSSFLVRLHLHCAAFGHCPMGFELYRVKQHRSFSSHSPMGFELYNVKQHHSSCGHSFAY
jgi:hypothetical protein